MTVKSNTSHSPQAGMPFQHVVAPCLVLRQFPGLILGSTTHTEGWVVLHTCYYTNPQAHKQTLLSTGVDRQNHHALCNAQHSLETAGLCNHVNRHKHINSILYVC